MITKTIAFQTNNNAIFSKYLENKSQDLTKFSVAKHITRSKNKDCFFIENHAQINFSYIRLIILIHVRKQLVTDECSQ